MKRFLLVALSLIVLNGTTFAAGVTEKKEVKVQTSAKCKMCKARLERTLGLSKGVESAQLDLKDKVLTVQYNSKKTSEDAIRETIRKTGYDADNLAANQQAHDKLPKCCRKTAAAH